MGTRCALVVLLLPPIPSYDKIIIQKYVSRKTATVVFVILLFSIIGINIVVRLGHK